MLKWRHKRYTPIGLDWAATALRAVQLFRGKDSLQVHAALEIPIPAGSDRVSIGDGSTDDDKPSSAELLQRLILRGGFVGKDVVLHCPAEKMDMRIVELPAGNDGLPRQVILGALKLQMGGKLSLPVEKAVHDYVPLGHDRQRGLISLMAITADAQWIKQRIETVESMGLRCVGVEPLAYALTRLVNRGSPGGLRVSPPPSDGNAAETTQDPTHQRLAAVLDIGYSGSTLMVSNNQGPIFCRRFALGGREITDILAQRLLIDFYQAERLKCTYGLDCRARRISLEKTTVGHNGAVIDGADSGNSSVPTALNYDFEGDCEIAKAIYAALQSDLNDYVVALTRALNYVITTVGGAGLEKIQLCGSGAHLKNLDEYFSSQFDLPVEIISHPLLEEIVSALPATRARAGSWATALGLALLKEMN